MHKLANGNVPKPLQNLYQCNKNVHLHFTGQTNQLYSMKGNNKFTYRTFVFQSVFIWNTVTQNININVSYERVEHLLKDFLLSNDISLHMTNENKTFDLYLSISTLLSPSILI